MTFSISKCISKAHIKQNFNVVHKLLERSIPWILVAAILDLSLIINHIACQARILVIQLFYK